MKKYFTIRLKSEAMIRILADIILINLSLATALVFHLIYISLYTNGFNTGVENIELYVNFYLTSFWIITGVCILVFFFSGFYSRGRLYQGKYKAWLIFQSVSIAYLIFAFISLILQEYLQLPRSIIILSWGINVGIILIARLWSILWKTIISKEDIKASKIDRNNIGLVLVIGGAGYIGSALIQLLLDTGYRVRLLDILIYGTEPIKDMLKNPKLEVIEADFRQIGSVVEAMEEVDAVVHLGAIVGDPACALNEKLTIEVNLMATKMIAEVAKGRGVKRFIFASTCSVYGASDFVLNERSSLNPVSLYAQSKIASERVLFQLADHVFPPTILRFGTIYGLSGRTRFDLVVNLLTAQAVFDKKVTVFGADQWRPFVHVSDAAQAIYDCIKAPSNLVRNQIFNVGSDSQNYTIGDIGRKIKALIPEANVIESESNDDRRNYRVDFTKISKILNYTPKWSLEQGIQQIIAAIKDGKITDYQDPKYSNVKFLSEEGSYKLKVNGEEWVKVLLETTSSAIEKEFS